MRVSLVPQGLCRRYPHDNGREMSEMPAPPSAPARKDAAPAAARRAAQKDAPVEKPPTLADLAAAQPQAVAHLTQALAGDRQAHAFVLVGAAASHAPQLACALVAALVCEERAGRDACGSCAGCRRWHQGHHPSVHVLAPEGTQVHVPVAQVRALRGKLALVGRGGAPRVVHVPKAGALLAAAQNALLKSLEEPQGATTFVFVAEHASAMLSTLRSRVQVVRCGRRDEAHAKEALRRGGLPPRLADWAAPLVGDDVGAAEALVDAGLGQVVDRLEQALVAGPNAAELGRIAQELGQNPGHFALALAGVSVHVRDALLLRTGANPKLARDAKSHPLMAHVATNQLCAAADAVAHLQAVRIVGLNRPLALEGLLLLLNQSASS